MKRYFVRLAYKGTDYAGWQYQPNAMTVQEAIEKVFRQYFQQEISILGCGRTDSSVHASEFYFHFDTDRILGETFLYKMNLMLPKDIAFYNIYLMQSNAHARFDAISRSYEYHIHARKDPFKINRSYRYAQLFTKDLSPLNELAKLIESSTDFTPFCKTGSDVKTMNCVIQQCSWSINEDYIVFNISSDRFLRGMIRLIVGAGINLVNGKLNLDEIKHALLEKKRLSRDLSVPAHGLYLSQVQYPSKLYIMEKASCKH